MQVDKAVILWAGMGRRISSEFGGIHKAMIPLNGRMLMEYLLDGLDKAGIRHIVPIFGYRASEMEAAVKGNWKHDIAAAVVNDRYEDTNNLYSLLCAEKTLKGEDFVVINGDMVLDCHIIKEICRTEGNVIAIDAADYGYQLDSPRVLIENDRIYDIGRHLTIDRAQGYAIGIYKFSAGITEDYFKASKAIVSEKADAGYHEPLPGLMEKNVFKPYYTGNHKWMDVDEKKDVAKAEVMLKELA